MQQHCSSCHLMIYKGCSCHGEVFLSCRKQTTVEPEQKDSSCHQEVCKLLALRECSCLGEAFLSCRTQTTMRECSCLGEVFLSCRTQTTMSSLKTSTTYFRIVFLQGCEPIFLPRGVNRY